MVRCVVYAVLWLGTPLLGAESSPNTVFTSLNQCPSPYTASPARATERYVTSLLHKSDLAKRVLINLLGYGLITLPRSLFAKSDLGQPDRVPVSKHQPDQAKPDQVPTGPRQPAQVLSGPG